MRHRTWIFVVFFLFLILVKVPLLPPFFLTKIYNDTMQNNTKFTYRPWIKISKPLNNVYRAIETQWQNGYLLLWSRQAVVGDPILEISIILLWIRTNLDPLSQMYIPKVRTDICILWLFLPGNYSCVLVYTRVYIGSRLRPCGHKMF